MAFIREEKPTKGDLIRVRRKAGYYHFGVAVSDDRVIHFTAVGGDLSKDTREIKIIETPLEDFLRGDILEVEVPYNSKFSRDSVIRRARKYLNSMYFRKKPYNFIDNNCEHFARYCYDGSSSSDQVMKVAMYTIAFGSTTMGAALAAIAKKKRKREARKIEKHIETKAIK